MRNTENGLIKTIVSIALMINALMISITCEVAADWSPKNIIVMISDGWGYNQVDVTSIYQYGATGTQIYEQFLSQHGMSTYMAEGSYDPYLAWSEFGYVKNGATDSAAAATAMSTGSKTYSGSIGMDIYGYPLKHLSQRVEQLGKATGIVTSVQFSHATPAGFVAHNVSRGNYVEIAQEMILDSKTDVIMGCGNPFYDDNGEYVTPGNYTYVGGKALWDGLVSGAVDFDLDGNGTIDNSVEDADGDGSPDPWSLVQSLAEFHDLMFGSAPDRVIGVPQVYRTLQERRTAGASFNQNVPTLENMTSGALNVLDDDPDGFFLMVEGGAVDWACHEQSDLRMIEEQIDFNRSVEAVVEWVQMNSSWDETLLIVTGDHETGYLTGPGPNPNWEPIVNNGAGNLPGMEWQSASHTNSLIPFYAEGDGADLFSRYADEFDPVRGAYIDNVEVAHAVFLLMNLSVANELMATIEDMGLQNGIENSLTSKVRGAEKALRRGQQYSAVRKLNSFLREVESRTPKKLTEHQADELIAYANIILADLEVAAAPALAMDFRSGYLLAQNYPNPFNPETWIPYQLPEDADVTIRIYSASGQLIRILDLGYRSPGFYVDRAKAGYWDGKNEAGESVASGIYFYTIQAGAFTATRKMVITR